MNKNTILIVVILVVGFLIYNGTINLGFLHASGASGDDQRATAAVGLATGIFENTDEPSPSPNPGPSPVKPNQKDCTVCEGTGWVKQGDGHVTKCPNCIPNSKLSASVDEVIKQATENTEKELLLKNAELEAAKKAACQLEVAKQEAEAKLQEAYKPELIPAVSTHVKCSHCGEDCTCVNCKCSEGGECEDGCVCEKCHRKGEVEKVAAKAFDTSLTSKQFLVEASREYAEKNYERSAELVKSAVNALEAEKMFASSEDIDSVDRTIKKAKDVLKKKGVHVEPVYVFEKSVYDKFREDYAHYVDVQTARNAYFKQFENRPYTYTNGAIYAEDGTCIGGNCGVSVNATLGRYSTGFFSGDDGACAGGNCGPRGRGARGFF